jgi:protein ImuB
VALHLPDLSLEAFIATLDAQARERPVALQDRSGIVAVGPAAAALGIRPGQRRATALALASTLCLGQADEARDAQALSAVALVALHFTPSVTRDGPATVLLEVSSTLRLFGGLAVLAKDLRSRLALLGHRAVLACAPTPLGAALLARQFAAQPDASASAPAPSAGLDARPCGLQMPAPEVFLRQLDRLPVALLSGMQVAQDLRAMGVRTLAELRALPRDGLARRVGPALLQALDRARGDRPDPRAWLVAPERFESWLELQARADNAEQLLEAAGVLLARLLAWASARQGRVPRFELSLRHEPRHRADDDRVPALTVLDLALATPSSDAMHMQSLLRERLARLALPAPAIDLRIRCAGLVHEAPPSLDLFATRASVQAGFAQLIERLQARLGPDGVRQLCAVEDHRPERATRVDAVTATGRASAPAPGPGRAGTRAPATVLLTRPAWLLPEPCRLREQASRPLLDGLALQLLAGPERLESGWWDGALVVRDYFIAQAGDGALVWIYRSRLASSADEAGWFLHGWFG